MRLRCRDRNGPRRRGSFVFNRDLNGESRFAAAPPGCLIEHDSEAVSRAPSLKRAAAGKTKFVPDGALECSCGRLIMRRLLITRRAFDVFKGKVLFLIPVQSVDRGQLRALMPR